MIGMPDIIPVRTRQIVVTTMDGKFTGGNLKLYTFYILHFSSAGVFTFFGGKEMQEIAAN
jgi:hypothetical protein